MSFLLCKQLSKSVCSYLVVEKLSNFNSSFNTVNQYSKYVQKLTEIPKISWESQKEKSSSRNASKQRSVEKNISNELIQIDDPDSFGLLSRTDNVFREKFEHDEDDKKEKNYIENLPLRLQKLSTKQYSDIIKDHINKKQIKEALDVLEERMLKDNRVKPESYIYNLLISACADVGYTKKAFMLFNDMKRRALNVSGGVYTSLFTACANSPWREDGLLRATNLRNLMIEKMIEPNLTNYNSMIKAYGRLGDLKTVFQIADEMCSKGIKIRVHTFNFLLQSCISDREAGFRHALLTWRKMLNKREKPNIYTFNLMLRCIKDCNVGDSETLQNVIYELLPNAPNREPVKLLLRPSYLIDSVENTVETSVGLNETIIDQDLTTASGDSTVLSEQTNLISEAILPNFLSKTPQINGLISIGEIKTMEDRLMLIGGVDGFFQEMKSCNVTPDIKTLTQMLAVQPSTLESEEELLKLLKVYKIKPDINFYNVLIKKRCFRSDYESAKEVRKMIEKENKMRKRVPFFKRSTVIKLDVITFGVLALCCNTKDSACHLINEMKEKKLRINLEIMETLLKNATFIFDLEYIMFVLETIQKEGILVNDSFLSHLKFMEKKCKTILRGENTEQIDDMVEKLEGCTKYLALSKKWIAKMENLKLNEPDHPWTQFRENQPKSFQRSIEIKKPRRYKKPYRRVPRYVVKT